MADYQQKWSTESGSWSCPVSAVFAVFVDWGRLSFLSGHRKAQTSPSRCRKKNITFFFFSFFFGVVLCFPHHHSSLKVSLKDQESSYFKEVLIFFFFFLRMYRLLIEIRILLTAVHISRTFTNSFLDSLSLEFHQWDSEEQLKGNGGGVDAVFSLHVAHMLTFRKGLLKDFSWLMAVIWKGTLLVSGFKSKIRTGCWKKHVYGRGMGIWASMTWSVLDL